MKEDDPTLCEKKLQHVHRKMGVTRSGQNTDGQIWNDHRLNKMVCQNAPYGSKSECKWCKAFSRSSTTTLHCGSSCESLIISWYFSWNRPKSSPVKSAIFKKWSTIFSTCSQIKCWASVEGEPRHASSGGLAGYPSTSQFRLAMINWTAWCLTKSRLRRRLRWGPRWLHAVQHHLGGGTGHNDIFWDVSALEARRIGWRLILQNWPKDVRAFRKLRQSSCIKLYPLNNFGVSHDDPFGISDGEGTSSHLKSLCKHWLHSSSSEIRGKVLSLSGAPFWERWPFTFLVLPTHDEDTSWNEDDGKGKDLELSKALHRRDAVDCWLIFWCGSRTELTEAPVSTPTRLSSCTFTGHSLQSPLPCHPYASSWVEAASLDWGRLIPPEADLWLHVAFRFRWSECVPACNRDLWGMQGLHSARLVIPDDWRVSVPGYVSQRSADECLALGNPPEANPIPTSPRPMPPVRSRKELWPKIPSSRCCLSHELSTTPRLQELRNGPTICSPTKGPASRCRDASNPCLLDLLWSQVPAVRSTVQPPPHEEDPGQSSGNDDMSRAMQPLAPLPELLPDSLPPPPDNREVICSWLPRGPSIFCNNNWFCCICARSICWTGSKGVVEVGGTKTCWRSSSSTTSFSTSAYAVSASAVRPDGAALCFGDRLRFPGGGPASLCKRVKSAWVRDGPLSSNNCCSAPCRPTRTVVETAAAAAAFAAASEARAWVNSASNWAMRSNTASRSACCPEGPGSNSSSLPASTNSTPERYSWAVWTSNSSPPDSHSSARCKAAPAEGFATTAPTVNCRMERLASAAPRVTGA